VATGIDSSNDGFDGVLHAVVAHDVPRRYAIDLEGLAFEALRYWRAAADEHPAFDEVLDAAVRVTEELAEVDPSGHHTSKIKCSPCGGVTSWLLMHHKVGNGGSSSGKGP